MSSVLSINSALIALPLALVNSRYSGLSLLRGISCPKAEPVKQVRIARMLSRVMGLVLMFVDSRR